jgi:hypothetical protein
MSGTHWSNTKRGAQFVDVTMPRLVRAVEALTTELKRHNDAKEEEEDGPVILPGGERVGPVVFDSLPAASSGAIKACREKLVDSIVEQLEQHDVEAHQLDEAVYETHSRAGGDTGADTINNGGLESQVEYLVSKGCKVHEILYFAGVDI